MTAELALTKPEHGLTMDVLRAQMEAAKRFVDSGLLPTEIRTPQQALVIMTKGRELGVPPMYALSHIHVVKGKPTCSAELMLALVRRTYGAGAIRVAKTTNQECVVEYREQGWDGVSSYTFSMEDARQAGVTSNGTWKAYPAAMLRARAISAVVRFAFPEATAGLYTPEELGAEVRVKEDGEVVSIVDVTPEPVEPTPIRPVVEAPDGSTLAISDEDMRRARAAVAVGQPESEASADLPGRLPMLGGWEKLVKRAHDEEVNADPSVRAFLDTDTQRLSDAELYAQGQAFKAAIDAALQPAF